MHFFVLDSYSLSSAVSTLYGYVIDERGIFTEYIDGELDGNGCYVRITADARQIRIEQDSNGSFGLYLYQSGSYFAISNSFFKLQDFLKTRVPLSVNYDYCVAFLALGLASLAYEETAINEIKWLDRNAEVIIDRTLGKPQIVRRKEKLNFVSLESMEGCEILDRWFDRWTKIVHRAGKTNRLAVDLSGGFDSRLTFMLALASGCELNEIHAFTMVSENGVHQQDYAVAQEIAKHFGCDFKKRSYHDCKATDFTIDQILDLLYDTKMTFHQDALLWVERMTDTSFRMSGAAGELIRSYWQMDAEEFLRYALRRSGLFGKRHAQWVSQAIKNVIQRTIHGVCLKHSLPTDSRMVGHCLYRETRCRNHFGRLMLGGMAAGIYWLAPLLDKELHRLKIRFDDDADDNALMALMYERYRPELLEFPIEGGRTITAETVERAKAVNANFMRKAPVQNSVVPVNVPAHIPQDDCQRHVSIDDADSYFKDLIRSDSAKNLIVQNFSEGVYDWTISGMDRKEFIPTKPWQAMAGILKVFDNVEYGRLAMDANKPILDRYIYGNGEFVLPSKPIPVMRHLSVARWHKVVVSGEAWCNGCNERQKGTILLQVNFTNKDNNPITIKGLNCSDAYGQHIFVDVDSAHRTFRHEFHAPEDATSVAVGISNLDGNKNIQISRYSVVKAVWEDIASSDIRLLAAQNKYNWDKASVKLLPDADYEFTADEAIVEAGETDAVETILYEAQSKRFCLRKKFAVENSRSGKIEWRFTVPSDAGEYWLLVYAGVAGRCEDIGVLWKNVAVNLRGQRKTV